MKDGGINKMDMITFDQVKEKEMSSFIYPPISSEESIGKTISEIKHFSENYGFVNTFWCVIIFTDGTASYLDKDLHSITSFHRLTYSYADKETGEVEVFFHDTGNTFVENGLINKSILTDALKMLKEFRVNQRENERTEKIKKLETELQKLKSNAGDLFVAEQGDNKLIIPENMLQDSNLRTLVDMLNKEGFGLGSGHDGLEIRKAFDNGEVYYRMILSPYVGHMDQHVTFYKNK